MQSTAKLIATAREFSHDDEWIKYEIFRHNDNAFVISESKFGTRSGVFFENEKVTERDAREDQVRYLLGMDKRLLGLLDIEDDSEELVDRILLG